MLDYSFPIMEEKLTVDGEETGLIGIYHDGEKNKKNLLGYHTDNYKVLENKTLVELAFQTLEQSDVAFEINKSQSYVSEKRMYLNLETDKVFEVGDGDKHKLAFIVQNSYDGSLQYAAMVGAFRLICSNGAIIGKTFANTKHKHVVDFDAEKFKEQIVSGIENIPALEEMYNRMLEKKVTETWIRKTLENAVTMNMIGKIDFEQIYEISKNETNAYNFLQIMTFYATHVMKSYERALRFNTYAHKKIQKIIE